MLLAYAENPTKPRAIDSGMQDLIHRLTMLLHQAVPVVWVDGTWDEFDDRGLVYVRDYPRKPRQKASPPPDAGYVMPEEAAEEQDVKPDNPRRLRREIKMENYMAGHSERSTKRAKCVAFDSRMQQSSTVTDAGPAKRELTPQPAEEPPRKMQPKDSRSRNPIDQQTPSLRRSTRTRKNTSKYT